MESIGFSHKLPLTIRFCSRADNSRASACNTNYWHQDNSHLRGWKITADKCILIDSKCSDTAGDTSNVAFTTAQCGSNNFADPDKSSASCITPTAACDTTADIATCCSTIASKCSDTAGDKTNVAFSDTMCGVNLFADPAK